jgi:hypothetical protein
MDKKYKQTVIPSVKTGVINNNRKAVFDYYKNNLQGKFAKNQQLGLKIYFTKMGKKEIAYGRAVHIKKTAILQCLPQLVEVAEYNNFGIRKPSDMSSIIGYLNFKAKVKIDGKIENIRLSVVFRKDGKVYYNHEVNIIKK